jgi:hypothetical protein
MRTWFLLRNLSWPIILLGIVVFAVIAAWRSRLTGVWILAGATVLAVAASAAQIVLTTDFLMRHQISANYLVLIGVGYYAAMVTALSGWGVLAFGRKK